MKAPRAKIQIIAVSLLLACFTTAIHAQPALVSAISPAASPASAGGDSSSPLISRDGRYVLFSSFANNLATNAAGGAFVPVFPAQLNVYLYDRTNGTSTLVSANTNGTAGANGDCFASAISTNGQFVLFESSANNLVPGDTNGSLEIVTDEGVNPVPMSVFVNQVYVRDVINGLTTLVSVSTNGGPGNDVSRSSTMTPDGRYVAFVSAATNLVANDTNGLADIFVRDLQLGVTTLASVGAMYTNTTSIPTNSCEAPDISDNGRYVAFLSWATNLVPGVVTTPEIYVADLVGGTTILASTNSRSIVQSAFNTTDVVASDHVISADGQWVAYVACATNLGTWFPSGVLIRYNVLTGETDIVNTNALGAQVGYEINGRSLDMTPDGNSIAFITNSFVQTTNMLPDALWVWNAQSDTTTLVSADPNTNLLDVPDYYWPQISSDGRYVAFFSSVTNLTTNAVITNFHLYVYDSTSSNISLVDARVDGSAPASIPPDPESISTNGQFIAFDSLDTNLASGDANRAYDVFVADVTNNTVELISAASPALLSLAPNGQSVLSLFSVSTNARYVAFTSEAENLVTNDTNFMRDVFVRDMVTGSNTLVSVATNGLSGNDLSSDSAISADGRYVAFTSSASNLVAGDTNFARDVFVRDLQLGITTLVSVNLSSNGPGNADSFSPTISADGRYVLFCSYATNLAPGFSAVNSANFFWRDTQAGTTYPLSSNATYTGSIATMTTNGMFVASEGGGQPVYIWNMQTQKRIYTNSAYAIALALSQDGKYFAATTNTDFPINVNGETFIVNLTNNARVLLGSQDSYFRAGLQFSGDGRYLVFEAGSINALDQVILYDTQLMTTNLISKSYNSSAPGNGPSDSATISADGNFIAYRSLATNLVPGLTNSYQNIYLYGRVSGETLLVTSSQYGNFSADNHSLVPVFSGDSRTLLLTSWASDLGAQAFNQSGNIYAFSLYNSNSQPALTITITGPAAVAWPATAGQSYQVQYKNNLTDPVWQIVNGNVTIVGNQGYLTDLAPAPAQRFYRVMAY